MRCHRENSIRSVKSWKKKKASVPPLISPYSNSKFNGHEYKMEQRHCFFFSFIQRRKTLSESFDRKVEKWRIFFYHNDAHYCTYDNTNLWRTHTPYCCVIFSTEFEIIRICHRKQWPSMDGFAIAFCSSRRNCTEKNAQPPRIEWIAVMCCLIFHCVSAYVRLSN